LIDDDEDFDGDDDRDDEYIEIIVSVYLLPKAL